MTNTHHREAIFLTISRIPPGKICTYGHVARIAGVPGHARYVGHLLKNLPCNSAIPWHRVINSQGRSSFPEGSPMQQEQHFLLKQEGIEIKKQRIPLSRYLWLGE